LWPTLDCFLSARRPLTFSKYLAGIPVGFHCKLGDLRGLYKPTSVICGLACCMRGTQIVLSLCACASCSKHVKILVEPSTLEKF
jgi:hypothetical protein